MHSDSSCYSFIPSTCAYCTPTMCWVFSRAEHEHRSLPLWRLPSCGRRWARNRKHKSKVFSKLKVASRAECRGVGGTPQTPTPQALGPVLCHRPYGRGRIKVADVTAVADQLTLSQDYPGGSGRPKVFTGVCKWGFGGRRVILERCNLRKSPPHPDVAGSEGGGQAHEPKNVGSSGS